MKWFPKPGEKLIIVLIFVVVRTLSISRSAEVQCLKMHLLSSRLHGVCVYTHIYIYVQEDYIMFDFIAI